MTNGKSNGTVELEKRVEEELNDLHDDTDAIDLIKRFFLWRKTNSAVSGNGLDEMLKFMLTSLEQNAPLSDKLIAQFESKLQGIENTVGVFGSDFSVAARYLHDQWTNQLTKIDYDAKFYYLGSFLCQLLNEVVKNEAEKEPLALLSTYIDGPLMLKTQLAYQQLEKPQLLTDKDRKLAILPLYFLFIERLFPLEDYIDSPRFGTNAWDEGKILVIALARFIREPRSQGLLCSLYSTELPEQVDWQKNHHWIHDPANHSWLVQGIQNTTSIPHTFRP